ncbi:4-hydroxy-3-methylbut-2-enyl diphosphate reductase [Brucella pinnipedialis M163/99/10]|nr:4-hydroxy-3-methylbut-2-enyl diphosphate reductase [Brucella pinnipedialis M163/99/10]
MRLGVIADDFTGATDIAGFLVGNGLRTIQLNGVPADDLAVDADAVVISLKTRSCPTGQAIAESLAALKWLQKKQLPAIFLQILLHLRQHAKRQYRACHRCIA